MDTPLIAVVLPGVVDGIEHRLEIPVMEPPLLFVRVEHRSLAVPEIPGGGLLPVVDEPAHGVQLRRPPAGAHEHPERPTRFHRGQLCPVPDQHDLRSDLGSMRGESVQGQGASEGGLVDDHQLPGPQIPPAFVVFVEEFRHVLRLYPERFPEDFSRGR
ncbi:hypothetical protein QKE30_03065 [Corynebacterium sp. c24Ua_83]|nr:hypothetical protein [uncultured Corynebacterium sp.]